MTTKTASLDSETDLAIDIEPSVSVKRPIYTQDEANQRLDDTTRTLVKKPFWKIDCSVAIALSIFPIVSTLRFYKIREYIVSDLLAGLTAACLHLPQGLAFGILASLAPKYGLYVSFFPALLYMIFGTAPHVSFGTNAVIALATAELVETADLSQNVVGQSAAFTANASLPETGTTADDLLTEKAALAAGASFVVGVMLTSMGVFRLGIITSYLSSSFVGGFTSAAAFHIIASQISKGLGIKIPLHQGIGKAVMIYIDIFKGIPQVNICSLITTILTAMVLVLVKECINERFKHKMKMPIPIDFIVVVITTAISYFADLNGKYGMKICGNIPSGVPAPALPSFKPFDVLLPKAIEISVIVFFLTISIAKLLATRHNYDLDDNKELIAFGLSNFGSSFFQCFPSATAPPRSMLLSLMGAKTTLTNAFSCVIILACLLVIGPLFSTLPVPVLAAMVIVAVTKLLLQVTQLPSIYRINGYDFIIWIVTWSTAVFLDLVYGIICGLVISLFVVALQSQRGKQVSKLQSGNIGLLMGEKFHDVLEHTVMVTVESSLYFATAAMFLKKMKAVLDTEPHAVKLESFKMMDNKTEENAQHCCIKDEGTCDNQQKANIRYIIINLKHVNFVDMKGLQALTTMCTHYKSENVTVFFCECTKYMQKVLENADFYKTFPRQQMFFTLYDAVETVRAELAGPAKARAEKFMDREIEEKKV